MSNLSKFVQRHVDTSFKELKKLPTKGSKMRYLKVPKDEDCKTDMQRKKRLEKIEENERREKVNFEMEQAFVKDKANLEKLSGVRILENNVVVFGSNYRVGRIQLSETDHITAHEGSDEFTERFIKLLEGLRTGVDTVTGLLDTTIFAKQLDVFIANKDEEGRIEISVTGDIKVTPKETSEIQDMTYQSEHLFNADLTFGFNLRILRDVLVLAARFGHETVELRCQSPIRPLLFIAEGFEYLVAPIRVH
ncbi:hypothetical protein ACTQ45_00860 [Fundicoccus sp. Sow4_D5]|uniref:hypothetical protein n=1 Tax=Fundicoccus sp. Sow4_D5 TaxID=3438782 RepID=UPI003F8DE479